MYLGFVLYVYMTYITFFAIFIVSITLVKVVCVIYCRKSILFQARKKARRRKKEEKYTIFAPLCTVSPLSAKYLVYLFIQLVTM